LYFPWRARKQALRATVPGWPPPLPPLLLPSVFSCPPCFSPRPVGDGLAHACPLLQGSSLTSCSIFTSGPSTACAPAYASQATPAPPLGGAFLLCFALHTLPGFTMPRYLHHYLYVLISHSRPHHCLGLRIGLRSFIKNTGSNAFPGYARPQHR